MSHFLILYSLSAIYSLLFLFLARFLAIAYLILISLILITIFMLIFIFLITLFLSNILKISYNMVVTLKHQPNNPLGVFGTIEVPTSITSSFKFSTLEPPHSIIHDGEYTVTNSWSPKFGRNLPLIHGIVGHTGVRIHSGNTIDDTIGCVLIGRKHGLHLESSRVCLRRFLELVTFPFTLVVKTTEEL